MRYVERQNTYLSWKTPCLGSKKPQLIPCRFNPRIFTNFSKATFQITTQKFKKLTLVPQPNSSLKLF